MSRGVDLHPRDVAPIVAIALGVALAIVPFATPLHGSALVVVWLVSTGLRSVAPVHQHCHAHRKVFRHPLLDAAYDVVLMAAAGNTTAVWELQHVHGHHRRHLSAGDPAANARFGGGRLRFTVLGDAMSIVDSFQIARGRRRSRAKLIRQLAIQAGTLAVAIAADPILALAFVAVPWLALRWAVFWFSYAQHDDVPGTDVYSGSVTHFHWTNLLYLNVGHHTAHHDRPALHWTELPLHTRRILHRIPDTCLR